jgi:hypothetical protein
MTAPRRAWRARRTIRLTLVRAEEKVEWQFADSLPGVRPQTGLAHCSAFVQAAGGSGPMKF